MRYSSKRKLEELNASTIPVMEAMFYKRPKWLLASSPPSLHKPLKKTVRFATVNPTRTFSTTKQDLQNSWYNNADYDRFRQDCQACVRLLRDTSSPLPESFTSIGLEDLLSTHHQKYRDYLKSRHFYYVSKELYQQQRHGVRYDACVRMVSELYSLESTERALQRSHLVCGYP